jgi:hypothetical protein
VNEAELRIPSHSRVNTARRRHVSRRSPRSSFRTSSCDSRQCSRAAAGRPDSAVFAAGSAWFFLGEPITMAVVVCGTVIAAGVYLVNRG